MRKLLIIIGLAASCCYAEDIVPAGTPIMAKVLNTVEVLEPILSRVPIAFSIESGQLKNCLAIGFGNQKAGYGSVSIDKYICPGAVLEANANVVEFNKKVGVLGFKVKAGTKVKIINYKTPKRLNCKVED